MRMVTDYLVVVKGDVLLEELHFFTAAPVSMVESAGYLKTTDSGSKYLPEPRHHDYNDKTFPVSRSTC